MNFLNWLEIHPFAIFILTPFAYVVGVLIAEYISRKK